MVNEINLKAVREEAEKCFADGDFRCSEAVVAAIRNHFPDDIPIQAIAMASGFVRGVGGAKCVCGAVSGGVICLGCFFGRTEPNDAKVKKAMKLARELHSYFKENHKVVCCGVLTKDVELGSAKHMEQCVSFTGEITEKTAEIIARELGIKTSNTVSF